MVKIKKPKTRWTKKYCKIGEDLFGVHRESSLTKTTQEVMYFHKDPWSFEPWVNAGNVNIRKYHGSDGFCFRQQQQQQQQQETRVSMFKIKVCRTTLSKTKSNPPWKWIVARRFGFLSGSDTRTIFRNYMSFREGTTFDCLILRNQVT